MSELASSKGFSFETERMLLEDNQHVRERGGNIGGVNRSPTRPERGPREGAAVLGRPAALPRRLGKLYRVVDVPGREE